MNTTQEKSKLHKFILDVDLVNLVKISNESLIKIYKYLEPVPVFSKGQIDNIVDVIKRSTSSHFGVEQYPTDENKLVFIFYTIIKGHFLENANKRTASDIFMLFLYGSVDKRNTDLTVFDDVFEGAAEYAIKIAESKPEEKDKIIKEVEIWTSKIRLKLQA